MTEGTRGAILGVGIVIIGLAILYLVRTIHKHGYQDGATKVYDDITQFKYDEGDAFDTLVPGLNEAVYIAKYHADHYNRPTTGQSRHITTGKHHASSS